MPRREACLSDPERFLRTYFSSIFFNPFAKHHLAMVDAIWERAWSGGDKAVAAPRGDGKSQIAICMTIVAVLGSPVRFPVLIGNTLSKGRKLFKQFKSKFENSAKYYEFHSDFPELCIPVVSLRGAPQRAASQHVDGELTRISWSQELIVMPVIKCNWNTNGVGGKRLVYFGLDSAIRGEGFEETRPDLAIIDDPETREVAFSPTDKHRDIEDMIDGDVAGLAGPNSRLSRVVLTTIQNRRCYSFRVTDRKAKPTFEGDRYPLLEKWPENKELWDEYLSLRSKDQAEGCKDSPTALKFYQDHLEAMRLGSSLSNPHRFVSDLNTNGEPVEIDALQAFYNRIADWGLSKVLAELQQEPEEEEQEEAIALTAGKVQSRVSGLLQHELPKEDCTITVGLDIGNYNSHWVKVAWFGNATGVVVDYGVMESTVDQKNPDSVYLAKRILPSLYQWRSDITANNPPEFGLIDSGSGTHTEAVYEFVRQTGTPFAPSKGQASGRFHLGTQTADRRLFHHCYAARQTTERLWLYIVDVEFWKHWIQERFNTPTFDDAQQFNDGSLSLYSAPGNPKQHLAFAHHLVSEERRQQFVEGKGIVSKWFEKSKNNHWLDAIALAACAAGCLGVRLISRDSLQTVKERTRRSGVKGGITTPDGRPYFVTERN